MPVNLRQGKKLDFQLSHRQPHQLFPPPCVYNGISRFREIGNFYVLSSGSTKDDMANQNRTDTKKEKDI